MLGIVNGNNSRQKYNFYVIWANVLAKISVFAKNYCYFCSKETVCMYSKILNRTY